MGRPRVGGPEYVENGLTGCWIWQFGRNKDGYGIIGAGRAADRGSGACLAHKAYWEGEHGPVPEGMHLDHLCQNPACVKPEHLEVVTPYENQMRGRGATLTKDDVRYIRVEKAKGRSGNCIARELGVAKSTVLRTARGEKHAEVT